MAIIRAARDSIAACRLSWIMAGDHRTGPDECKCRLPNGRDLIRQSAIGNRELTHPRLISSLTVLSSFSVAAIPSISPSFEPSYSMPIHPRYLWSVQTILSIFR